MKSGLFDEDEVKEEAKRHNDYLNSVVGIVSFTLGLSCVGLPNPQKAAVFCLGIVIPLLVVAVKNFPPTIGAVRELAKESEDPHVIEVQKYLEDKYLGFKSTLTKNILYWYGLAFYCSVLFYPNFVPWLIQ